MRPKLYKLREKLGSGSFAQVFRIEYRPNENEVEVFAFKKFISFELNDREAGVISDEIETLSTLNHDDIVRLIGVSDDAETKDGSGKHLGIGIMMEYCENGSLRQYLDKMGVLMVLLMGI
jgi:serine/threonine protein kinase